MRLGHAVSEGIWLRNQVVEAAEGGTLTMTTRLCIVSDSTRAISLQQRESEGCVDQSEDTRASRGTMS